MRNQSMNEHKVDVSASRVKEEEFQQKVNQLLGLLTDGKQKEDDEIEAVLKSITGGDGNKEKEVCHNKVDGKSLSASGIEVDEDDYDNVTAEEVKASEPKIKMKIVDDDTVSETIKKDSLELEEIHMGTIGAKIMTSFGDGKNPNPAAVQEALQGTRLCLQAAIKQARSLYRKKKLDMRKAADAAGVRGRREKFDASDNVVDPELLFSVMVKEKGTLSRWMSKCGFTMDEFATLYPEQMHEFQKFIKLREETSSAEEKDNTGSDKTDPLEGEEHTEEENNVNSIGHMCMRREAFDLRTEQMKKDYYIEYAEIRRQGSFLPHSKSSEDKQWNTHNKSGRGRPKSDTWDGRHASSVQFLYWIGFDPRSALTPPNESLTQFLAFLGYDLMGRIVERAIEVRYPGKDFRTISNIPKGDQLSVQDVRHVLSFGEFGSQKLATVSTSTGSENYKPQLYFGEGFEDNLEVELEQLSGAIKKNTEKEVQVAESENLLFASIAKPRPKFDIVASLMSDVTPSIEKDKKTSSTSGRKRGRPRKKPVPCGEEGTKRKRGRPRKYNELSATDDLNKNETMLRKSKRQQGTSKGVSYNEEASSCEDEEYDDDSSAENGDY